MIQVDSSWSICPPPSNLQLLSHSDVVKSLSSSLSLLLTLVSGFLCARPSAESFALLFHMILTTIFELNSIVISFLQMMKEV